MIDLFFEPNDDETIYHYCSAETLMAILESKKIRFTDINMTNDSAETHWAYSIFEEAATKLITRKNFEGNKLNPEIPIITEEFINEIDKIVSETQLITHPFISCFSVDGNSLSQWRAYADDGRGYAIGFNAKYLQKLPISLLRVEYSYEQQVKKMMAGLIGIFLECSGNPENDRFTFIESCILLGNHMTALKHPSFHEEKEIRSLHAINIEKDDSSMRFKDLDNNKVEFLMRESSPCAYLDIPLIHNKKEQTITEIIIGPKNSTFPGNISLYLGGLGYKDVKVGLSLVPYR